MDADKRKFYIEIIIGMVSLVILTAGVFLSTLDYGNKKTVLAGETETDTVENMGSQLEQDSVASTDNSPDILLETPSEETSLEEASQEVTTEATEEVRSDAPSDVEDDEGDSDSDEDSETEDDTGEGNRIPVKDLYKDYIFRYLRNYPNQILTSAEAYDLNNDGIDEMVLLWKNGSDSNKEEVITIREGDVIRIFSTMVEYYNLWLAKNDKGDILAKVRNSNGSEYIIHDFGYELFGGDSKEKDECYLSQRYTANDRDYDQVTWNPELMVVSREEKEDAWNTLVGNKVYVDDHSCVETEVENSMEDDEIQKKLKKIFKNTGDWDKEIIKKDDENRLSGDYIGKVYVVYLGPDGVNLHDTDDIKEESINKDLGPVGAGYKENMNGDEFYVKESVKGSDGKDLYLLDNGCYISASPAMVSFVELSTEE